MSEFNLDLKIDPQMPLRKDWRIGTIGAGAIIRGCHQVAYRQAGFNSYAIASLNESQYLILRFWDFVICSGLNFAINLKSLNP